MSDGHGSLTEGERLPTGYCHVPSDHLAHTYVYMGGLHWCRGQKDGDPLPDLREATTSLLPAEGTRSLAEPRNNVKAACLAAKAAYPGSTWNDPGEEPDVQFDSLMADLDRFRDALERVYQQGRGVHVEIARDALNV